MDDLVLDDASARTHSRVKLLQHLALSGIVGFAAAVIVSSILYLTVTNKFFAYGYSAVMLVTGLALVARAKMQCTSTEARPLLRIAVAGALITTVSAVSSLGISFMRHDASLFLSILYSLSSIGSLYALAFIGTDVLNRAMRDGGELTAKQLYSIAAIAVVVGSWSGFLFNMVDVEQHVSRFGYEQWVTACIAALGGCVIGYVNYFSQDESLKTTFDPLPMDDFTPTNRGFDVDA